MSLITLRGINVSFGGPALLKHIDFQIEPGERVCLVGRNGEGKSTLFKVISGEIPPDGGEIMYQRDVKISRLTQEVPHDITGTVFDVVAEGLGKPGEILADYHSTILTLANNPDEALLKRLEKIQHEIDITGGWQVNQQVDTILSVMKLDPDSDFPTLSGGMKRRVLLARALVNSPDLLLLDEPTNHLDIESIDWLENFLLNFKSTLLFITHDRMLLKKLATRIIELDRGQLTSWDCDYNSYLKRKQAMLDSEAEQNALFDKKLAKEEAWIRQGIKARRTRNEGRVRALEALRETRRARRELSGTVKMQLQNTERSGKIVIEASNINHSYNNTPLIKDFSTTILRGDKIGIIGPNGVGKTTLLNILLGKLEPEQGTVKTGTNLEAAYFDQHRSQLNEEKSVQDNVAEGSDQLTINGKPRHVMSYLQDFLFAPDRARTPVKALSGGERNRLLLAKLFTRPTNILVLDEPTNDLDIETLDLLEELLLDYSGTLLLVSHDRAFINNVVTSTLVFEGNAIINEYVGGYDDWLRQSNKKNRGTKPSKVRLNEKPQVNKAKKLSYKEQRELEELPRQIENMEGELQTLTQTLTDPAFYQQQSRQITATKASIEELTKKLEASYQRWEELDSLSKKP